MGCRPTSGRTCLRHSCNSYNSRCLSSCIVCTRPSPRSGRTPQRPRCLRASHSWSLRSSRFAHAALRWPFTSLPSLPREGEERLIDREATHPTSVPGRLRSEVWCGIGVQLSGIRAGEEELCRGPAWRSPTGVARNLTPGPPRSRASTWRRPTLQDPQSPLGC